jgi:hypothetical protein
LIMPAMRRSWCTGVLLQGDYRLLVSDCLM